MLTGYMIPVLLLNMTQALSRDTMEILVTTFSIFIPFVPFFNSMVGIVLIYLINKLGLENPTFFYITTFAQWQNAIPLMIAQGFIFFIMALFIDLKYQDYFRKEDLKVPSNVPLQLEPDSDVVEEENRVA